ncbi:Xylulose kinase [Rubrobacter xylanophilus DSM 9941]|nr:Xylulose kinase [Rubrobacter xylanophilus DSM 9941]
MGLDLGTGSVKALLMEEGGTVAGVGSAACTVCSPLPGRAESDPEEWWRAAGAACREALRGRGDEVVALGLSGQMHGVVLTGGDGAPLRPAILWADARSAGVLEAYRRLPQNLRRTLANPPAAGMAGPTLLWLREYEPAAYAAARWALQPKDWLRMRLTGEALSEPSDASATLLYDLAADRWSREVVRELGLREELLPPLLPSDAVCGELLPGAARHLGLPEGLPVVCGGADTACAMLGTGLLAEGEVQLTVGTGAQVVSPRRGFVPDPSLRTHLYRAVLPGRRYAMAAVQNAGLALEWVREVLGVSWETLYAEAAAVPPGSCGVVFLPYVSGERTPHLDPAARGAWAGLGLGCGRGHLLRAALEGVAFAVREALEALEGAGIRAPEELRLAGGGSLGEDWRRLLAGVLGRPLLILPDSVASVASARGAALLAGLALGRYRGPEELPVPRPEGVVEPGGEAGRYEEAYRRFRELYPRLRGL